MNTVLRCRTSRINADAIREGRLAGIKGLIEQFTYELARAMAGHEPRFAGMVAEMLASRLRYALQTQSTPGAVCRPSFGPFAELRIEGDLLNVAMPVRVRAQFQDRSLLVQADGRVVPLPRRQVCLDLIVSLDSLMIESCTCMLSRDAFAA